MVETCKQMGIRKPTKIQELSIPAVLSGKDVIGRAKTGSGKTAAFALPILHHLSEDPYGVFAIVLTPTRELAYQISEQFRAFGAPLNLRETVVVGGMDMLAQNLELSKNPHVIIATPGRLADLIRNGAEVHLEHLQYIVLDEADRLYESCFDPDLKTIMDACPEKEDRQTLLFSATLPDDMLENQIWTKKSPAPVFLEDTSAADQEKHLVETLDQRYIFIPQHVKECYLAYVLMQQIKKLEGAATAIVFVSTCRGCEVISEFLSVMEIECVSLHSHKNQTRRFAALGKFRSGKAKVMVATDVASRGLDIPSVQMVINYDLPRVCEDYVHRVGRTARAGRGGLALSLVSQYDINVFKQIETFINKEMDEHPISEEKCLSLLKEVNQAKRMAKVHLDDYELTSKKVKRRKKRARDDGGDGGDFKSSSSSSGGKKKKNKKKAAK